MLEIQFYSKTTKGNSSSTSADGDLLAISHRGEFNAELGSTTPEESSRDENGYLEYETNYIPDMDLLLFDENDVYDWSYYFINSSGEHTEEYLIPLFKHVYVEGDYYPNQFGKHGMINKISNITSDFSGLNPGEAAITFDATSGYDGDSAIFPEKLDLIDSDGTTILATSNEDATEITGNKLTFNGLIPGKTYENVTLGLTGYDDRYQSDSFTFTAAGELAKVDEIDSANITESTPTGFSFDFTSIDSGAAEMVDNYTVKTSADGYSDGIQSEVFTTPGEHSVTLDTLTSGETYNNITLQLIDSDGTTELGSPFLLADTITIPTIDNKVDGIDSLGMVSDSTTYNGFSFKFKPKIFTSNINGDVSPFGAKVFLGDDYDNPIFETANNAFTTLDEQTVLVDTLNPGTTYDDINVQLFDNEGKLGDKKHLVDSVTTILQEVEKLETVSLVPDSITTEGFDFKFKAEDASLSETISSKEVLPYGIKVYSDGDYNNPIFQTANDAFSTTDEQTVTVTGLELGKEYKNVYVQLFDKDNEKIDTEIKLSDSIKINWFNVAEIETSSFLKNSETTDGFKFQFKAKFAETQLNTNDSMPYGIKVFARGYNKPIFKTAEDEYTTIDEQTVTVTSLHPDEEYHDVQIQLFDKDNAELGPKVDLISSVVIKSLYVEEVESGSIIDGSITNEGFDFKFKAADPSIGMNDVNVNAYGVKVYSDGDYTNPLLETTANEFSTTAEQTLTVTGLTEGKTYNNVEIQLFDETKEYGSKFTIADEVSINFVQYKINGINNANITSPSDDGFTFDLELNLGEIIGYNGDYNETIKHTPDYKVYVYANNDYTNVLGTSETLNSENEKDVTITGLSKGMLLEQVNLQIVSATEEGKKYGELFNTEEDIVITLNEAQNIAPTINITAIDHKSFSLNLEVLPSIVGETYSQLYQIDVLADGASIWKSGGLYEVGIKDLTIDNLKPNSTYKNVTVVLEDMSEHEIGSEVFVADAIKLKFSFLWWMWLIIAVVSLAIITSVLGGSIYYGTHRLEIKMNKQIKESEKKSKSIHLH